MAFSSLYIAATGIKSFSGGLNSVSDNLANVSTHGYKATRANFEDILYTQLGSARSVGSPQTSQVGHGSAVGFQNMMIQGSLEYTDNPLDMAISGNGFFIVQDAESGEQYYTRAGQFHLDNERFLVNDSNLRVMGFAVDADGNPIVGNLVDINIPYEDETRSTTSLVDIGINLDPTTTSYASNYVAYDNLGESHNMATHYEKIDNYTGALPAGTTGVWFAQTYEIIDGQEVANPPGDNAFYMFFDGDGQLVGTGRPGAGGVTYSYNSNSALAGTGSTVSNRLGETFSFNGLGGTQRLNTSAAFNFTGLSAGASLTIGSSTYSVADGLTAAQASAQLANQINLDGSASYYAVTDGAGGLELYTRNNTGPFEVSSTGNLVQDELTLEETADWITNGRAATGSISLDTTGLAKGAYFTIAGVQFTYDDGTLPPPTGDNLFTTGAELATLINDNVTGATATYTAGTATAGTLSITADEVGTDGNQIAMAFNGLGSSTDVRLSGTTLASGTDSSADHDVVATAAANGDGTYSLSLTRQSDPSAEITVLETSNLAGNLYPDFCTFTRNFNDPGATIDADGQVAINYQFAGVGVQTITYDYAAEGHESTQVANGSEMFYLDQNGYPVGTLETVSVADNGVIWGNYSNGESVALGAVALSTFNSPGELQRIGDNLWQATAASGEARISFAGDPALAMGTIESGALEASNVDMSAEFVNMILYQRAFQANSKAITTSDEMLKTAINIKT